MSLVNFSAPFYATPAPLTTHYYHPQPHLQQSQPQQHQQHHQQSYFYSPPQKPFRREDEVPARNQPAQPAQPAQSAQPQQQQKVPTRPPSFTKVSVGGGGTTRVHAILDYDDSDYYDDGNPSADPQTPVTPIQGPILLKNGSVPVVPLYSYPVINNGSFVQIPILWTALSVALGLEVRADYIRGVPCIKKYEQLYCPTAGSSYPLDRIEIFIDENKALMKRMYGDFTALPDYGGPGPGGGSKRKRSVKPGVPDHHAAPDLDANSRGASSYFAQHTRVPRQSFRNNNVNNQTADSGRVDACESKVEIITPYWASNSAGKIRAIVNTQHFEQAIHQEICSKVRTKRCIGECGCEQKYKWHRLLAYDPDNDCKGIFMDWFLFPSCCVCRCNP